MNMKWFDRKFTFNNLEETFPEISERLKDTPIRLSNTIKTIPEEFFAPSFDGSWTIKEQVGRLGDLESSWATRFADFINGKAILTEADLANRKTYDAGHNQKKMICLMNNFFDQRFQLCEFLESIKSKAGQGSSRYPRLLTPMRPIDLAYFVAEHDDHHLAWISEINQILTEKVAHE
jgi:hypothetical protein